MIVTLILLNQVHYFYIYFLIFCNFNFWIYISYTECNYVRTTDHFYPINACESNIDVISGDVSSFKYICNGNNVIKEIYNTFECDGNANEIITDLTNEIEHYICRSSNGNCGYAMKCSYTNCGDAYDRECEECSSVYNTDILQQNHNTQCRPFITDQCSSNLNNGLFKMNTCSNGVLTEGYYYDSECKQLCLEDKFGGDYYYMCKDRDLDGVYTYYEIDCNPWYILCVNIFLFYINTFKCHFSVCIYGQIHRLFSIDVFFLCCIVWWIILTLFLFTFFFVAALLVTMKLVIQYD